MAAEITVDIPVLKGEKGDKGDTGSFDYTHLEEIVDEHLDNRFADVDASLDLKVDKEVGKSLVDDEYIEKLNNLETLDKTVVEKFNDKVEQKDFEDNLIQMESQLQNYIDGKLVTAGSGDMLKSIYDTDGNGVVDKAENANNADKVNNLTVETAVPPDAVFTDTTYSLVTNEVDGLMSATDKVKLNGIQSGANFTEIIDNLTSEETTKALSAAQGKNINDAITSVREEVANIQNNVTELKKITRTLLFEGAVNSGLITLSDNAFNYRTLVVMINNKSTEDTEWGYLTMPVMPLEAHTIANNQPIASMEINSTGSQIATIVGMISVDGTQLTIQRGIRYMYHKSATNHTYIENAYYIKKVWGIR